ncbi:protein FAR1-RELATED SEQUENCE 6-like [Rhododendron vialii]|uniref:protein FAR1-RELATED SEQUENCE 6-like n=1 Tax=Rhododendron vialii TaxID=182163 RepID=UPI00265DC694|nr:protein FAR1-RELATED SEQUENCE 6-like [Rhododendron vialii]
MVLLKASVIKPFTTRSTTTGDSRQPHPPLPAATTSRKNLLGPAMTPPSAPLPTTKVMFPMSSDSVPSTMLPRSSNRDEIDTNEKNEVWSGYNGDEEEVSSGSSKKECDEICTNEDGKEEIENFEDSVEQPKEGMIFDTPNDAYLYYSRYAKENGCAVAKRTNKKERDENLRNVTFQCCHGRKAKVNTTNPVKPRPQTKIECPARLNFAICPDGKWRLNRVALEHNHEYSPGKLYSSWCESGTLLFF